MPRANGALRAGPEAAGRSYPEPGSGCSPREGFVSSDPLGKAVVQSRQAEGPLQARVHGNPEDWVRGGMG